MSEFSGILGHSIPKRFFRNFLSDRDRMPHALLLAGPPGVGKFAMAFNFAKIFNCKENGEPNCLCQYCRQIRLGTYSDVLISSSMSEIKAEQMRQLTNDVVITPEFHPTAL